VKYDGKYESFGKECRWTKFNAVERVTTLGLPSPFRLTVISQKGQFFSTIFAQRQVRTLKSNAAKMSFLMNVPVTLECI